MINDSAADSFALKALCFPSQKKNQASYKVRVDINKQPLAVEHASCDCPVGLAEGCGHIAGLLYTFANHQLLGHDALPMDVVKTSIPQTFHVPRGPKIGGKEVQDVEVYSYNNDRNATTPNPISSTLYNPIRTPLSSPMTMYQPMSAVQPRCMALDIMRNDASEMVTTKFGMFPKGSVLSYQQHLSGDYVFNIKDNTGFPVLPLDNFMKNSFHGPLSESQSTTFSALQVTPSESQHFEESTRLQSDTKTWFRIRKCRITASNCGVIARRKKADVSKLLARLKSTKHVQTRPMKDGLAREPKAATKYSHIKDNKVNLYPCGCIVNCWASWLAATPDRKVYDPSKPYPYGLLEVKCPEDDTVTGADWLHVKDGKLQLKRTHPYFYQVIMQLAVSGLPWCDFLTWCYKDDSYHLETFYFEEHSELWNDAKNAIDIFFFTHFLE